jgi:hypothetical protein
VDGRFTIFGAAVLSVLRTPVIFGGDKVSVEANKLGVRVLFCSALHRSPYVESVRLWLPVVLVPPRLDGRFDRGTGERSEGERNRE